MGKYLAVLVWVACSAPEASMTAVDAGVDAEAPDSGADALSPTDAAPTDAGPNEDALPTLDASENDATDDVSAPMDAGSFPDELLDYPEVDTPDESDPLPSTGCGLEPPLGSLFELRHEGRARSATLHLPPSYDPAEAMPLILAFHGYGGSPLGMANLAELDQLADAERFIVAYPEGTSELLLRSFNGGACCGTAMSENIDDVGFTNKLLNRLERAYCIDTRRVYATGMSNGGFLSHRLACELSERIAAIAPVAGVIGITQCAPARRVPVFQIHGTADDVVPYEGNGASYPSVANTILGWTTRNGCDDQSTTYLDQEDIRCESWAGCADDAEVRLCTVEAGGHTWPGGQPSNWLGRTTRSLSASQAMWSFFRAHPLP